MIPVGKYPRQTLLAVRAALQTNRVDLCADAQEGCMRRAFIQAAFVAVLCLTSLAAFPSQSSAQRAFRTSSPSATQSISRDSFDRQLPEGPWGPILRRITRLLKQMVGQEEQVSVPKP